MAAAFAKDALTISLRNTCAYEPHSEDANAGRYDVPELRTWGLSLNLLWPAPPELAATYATLGAAIHARLASAGVHVYAAPFTHITVSSPAPFTNTELVHAEDRAEFVRRFVVALRDTCTSDAGFPTAGFPLVLTRSSFRLSKAAAFVIWDDPEKGVARIRACLQRALDTHPALNDAEGRRLLLLSKMRTPDIVHTTLARFTEDIPCDADAAPDAAWTESRVRAAFAAAVDEWDPAHDVRVEVRVPFMRLAAEVLPFMHLDARGAHASCILTDFEFR